MITLQFISISLILLLSFQSVLAIQPQGDSSMAVKNGNQTITSGEISLSVDPNVGGRIVSFKLGDYEFLTGTEINP